jgi:hypothetical protein
VFTARLRERVDLDALAAELVAVANQTMQPTYGHSGCDHIERPARR